MASLTTVHYAGDRKDYFWKWSRDDQALEWSDGTTIALRDEVLTILKNLSTNGGIPPIGSLFLVLAACSSKTEKAYQELTLAGEILIANKLAQEDNLTKYAIAVKASLETVESLAEEYRHGIRAKLKLCHAIFNRDQLAHKEEEAQKIVFELESEPHSQWIHEKQSSSLERLLRDGKPLIQNLAGIDKDSLLHRIETGLEFTEILEIQVPEEQVLDERDSRPLLEQLLTENSEIAGIARLAQQVISFLSIPKPASLESELSVGGVSDIVNRGTPDRLLLSELAWDDLTFVMRLAQKEALYYHRETPPEKALTRRIVLMDHGLRYWGLLRLFAHSVALGLIHHPSQLPDDEVKSFVTSLNIHQKLPLMSKEEVKKALEDLPVHISPEASLLSISDELEDEPEAFVTLYFIATEDAIRDPETKSLITKVAEKVRESGGTFYQILIAQDGELSFSEHLGKQIKHLKSGKLDLDAILPVQEKLAGTPPKKASEKLLDQEIREVAHTTYYDHFPPPIRFIEYPDRPDRLYYKEAEKTGKEVAIGISYGRLTKWDNIRPKATQLSYKLRGKEHWVELIENYVIVVCSASKVGESVSIYRIDETGVQTQVEIVDSLHAYPRNVIIYSHYVVLLYSSKVEAISLEDGQRIDVLEQSGIDVSEQNAYLNTDRKLVLDGAFSSLNKWNDFSSGKVYSNDFIYPEAIGISERGDVLLYEIDGGAKDVYKFSLKDLRWTQGQPNRVLDKSFLKELNKKVYETEKPLMQCIVAGVTITYDNRGLLHLFIRKEYAITISLAPDSPSVWAEGDNNLSNIERFKDELMIYAKINQKK